MAADATTTPAYHAPEIISDLAPAAASTDALRPWQYMISGSVAGIVEHTAMFPIDCLKTRMQASCPPCRPLLSIRAALRSALADGGLPVLYRGLPAMALGAGPAHAAYFCVYELSKMAFGPTPNPAFHAVSGALATVAGDAVFTPMDTVKQRLQLPSSPYRGLSDCIRKVIQEEGARAFFASYKATVVMNAPFGAVYFATYESAKGLMDSALPGSTVEDRVLVHATAGAAAGSLAALVTTPLDVAKTQLQCQGVCGCERFSSSSMWEVIETIVKRDGLAGLSRGWKPRMLFHAPAAAIVWSTYEASKSFFERFNNERRNSSK